MKKYRIRRQDGKYLPEIKRLLGWGGIIDSVIKNGVTNEHYHVYHSFDSQEEAERFINNYHEKCKEYNEVVQELELN